MFRKKKANKNRIENSWGDENIQPICGTPQILFDDKQLKPCSYEESLARNRNNNMLIVGASGAFSKNRVFKKDEFNIDWVPSYALIKVSEDDINVFDCYGQTEHYADTIRRMRDKGWVTPEEYKAEKYPFLICK